MKKQDIFRTSIFLRTQRLPVRFDGEHDDQRVQHTDENGRHSGQHLEVGDSLLVVVESAVKKCAETMELTPMNKLLHVDSTEMMA
uniref:Uncharacterized protein n=1 Tax=Globodera rostochiensis TaxID=31243 RepID=A0A914H2T7_GLORO